MASFFFNPNDYPLGAAPAEWVDLVGGIFALSIIEFDGAKALEIRNNAGVAGRYPVAWTVPGSPANYEIWMDANQYGQLPADGTSTQWLAMGSYTAGADANSLSCYAAGWRHQSGYHRIVKYVGGTFTELTSELIGQNSIDQRLRSLMTKSGTSFQSRVWFEGADISAPSGTLTATDSSLGAGQVGVHNAFPQGVLRIRGFGVGTNGDAAPRRPLPSSFGGASSITSAIYDANGVGVANAKVVAVRSDEPFDTYKATTAADGSFTITGMTDGAEWEVYARADALTTRVIAMGGSV
nr:carboxypeptidase-like regulatory domain-containing protein [Paracoccus saliphilus]